MSRRIPPRTCLEAERRRRLDREPRAIERADASPVAVDIQGDAHLVCAYASSGERWRYGGDPRWCVAPDEVLFATSKRKSMPFDWVLAELDSLGPTTNPMFGCTAVYVVRPEDSDRPTVRLPEIAKPLLVELGDVNCVERVEHGRARVRDDLK